MRTFHGASGAVVVELYYRGLDNTECVLVSKELRVSRSVTGQECGECLAAEMFCRHLAQALNAGLSAGTAAEICQELCEHDSFGPAIQLPWKYWGSSLSEEHSGYVGQACTHYFVDEESRKCLVWQEDVSIEVVPVEDVGL